MLHLLLAAILVQTPAPADSAVKAVVLVPDAVWDGVADAPRRGWAVLVRGTKIEAVGPAASLPADGADRVELPGTTLIPGLIEGHSHLFLHPYNETLWDDQVLKEPLALRMARAVAAAAATLRAGITTERDLGTEGAFDSDVQLRRAIAQGIVPGPRILAVTRAIVATGSYGPSRSRYSFDPPQGAEEADRRGADGRVVRSQIGHGADWVKVYADYRWGPNGEARPTFTLDELKAAVDDGARRRPTRGGARDDAGGDAPRDSGGRRDGGTRRRGNAGGIPPDAPARGDALSRPSPPRKPTRRISTAGSRGRASPRRRS